jgi:hypothetical protein
MEGAIFMGTMDIKMQEQKIRELAYNIWERDGRPYGRDLEYWLKAERSLAPARGTTGPGFIEAPAPLQGELGESASMALRLKPTTRRASTPRKASAKGKKTAR